jgi:quinone-modifying oxidoreductase, subunit QmoC
MDYKQDFAKEVYSKVDSGAEIKVCMQCGICASTCPLREHMKYSPRKIWTLIRAGRRQEVLTAPDIMLCTSCYTCKVRCPRGIPVIDVMHGLAHYALSQGIVPREETAKFGGVFWKGIYDTGRVDESVVPVQYCLKDGMIAGLKKSLSMLDIGLALLKAKRMVPKLFIPPNITIPPSHKIKGLKQLQKMLDKAATMNARKEA